MVVTGFDIRNLRALQAFKREASQVFAGIKAQYYFCYITPESTDNVCGLDGIILDVRPHPDPNKVFVDFAIATHIYDFYSSYENIELVRLYTNCKDIEQNFGFIFAQADKVKEILETCNDEEPYLFLEEQT